VTKVSAITRLRGVPADQQLDAHKRHPDAKPQWRQIAAIKPAFDDCSGCVIDLALY